MGVGGDRMPCCAAKHQCRSFAQRKRKKSDISSGVTQREAKALAFGHSRSSPVLKLEEDQYRGTDAAAGQRQNSVQCDPSSLRIACEKRRAATDSFKAPFPVPCTPTNTHTRKPKCTPVQWLRPPGAICSLGRGKKAGKNAKLPPKTQEHGAAAAPMDPRS